MAKKSYSYYISYLKEDECVYAYTDDKKLAKKFRKSRNPDRFVHKIKELTSDDLWYLHKDYPGGLIGMEAFDIEGMGVLLPLTRTESVTVLNMSTQLLVEFPAIATVNPAIFSDEIYEILEKIGYVDCYRYYIGEIDDCGLSVDKFAVFNYLYPDMLNLRGGNLFEVISILLDRHGPDR